MSLPSQLYEHLLARAEAPTSGPPPRASSAVVPWRTTAEGGLEVYWVRRSPRLRFMGGWWAFPGGAVDRADASRATEGTPTGVHGKTFHPPAPSLDDEARETLGVDLAPGVVTAALRELFEETGLLLCAPPPAATTLAESRRALLNGDVEFGELLDRHALSLDASRLVFAGRWLTPPFAPRRFDNRFFLLEWSAAQPIQPSILPGELAEGEWITPRAALARWRSGEALAAPPILHILGVLAEDGVGDAAHARLRDTGEANLASMRRIELVPGVVMLPVRTPTLPPAATTNCFLVGDRDAVLIDPATPLPDEQARLIAAVDAARARGTIVRSIVISHHHIDHVGAVERLRAHLGVPVLAHEASRLPLRAQGIDLDGVLEDGARLQVGRETELEVVHTPGHTHGHLAFALAAYGTLLCGDLVSALSTIVIDPPEGDMDAYIRSLERATRHAPRLLLPAHGPPLLNAPRVLEKARAHRLDREQQVLEAWQDGLRAPEAIVTRVYPDDLPAIVRPVAARQVLAHLARLDARGSLQGQ